MSENEDETDGGQTAGESPDEAANVDQPKRCANCGAEIETDEWHPVATRRNGDDFQLYAFCTEACREAWDGADSN